MKKIIIWAHGADQPGIVSGVSKVLFEEGFNLEDTSMAILEGHFAMIVIASGSGRFTLKQLEKKFAPLKKKLGLQIILSFLKETTAGRSSNRKTTRALVTVFGMDKPGIVYHVTQYLASRNINITDAHSHVTGNEESPIYSLVLEVEFPAARKVSTLARELEKVSRQIEAQIQINAIESGVL